MREAALAEHVIERDGLERDAEDQRLVAGERLDRGHDARERLLTPLDVLAHVEVHWATGFAGDQRGVARLVQRGAHVEGHARRRDRSRSVSGPAAVVIPIPS